MRRTGEDLLGSPKTIALKEIYVRALLRVKVRTVDGLPCWCLVSREEALSPTFQHDYRCLTARMLT